MKKYTTYLFSLKSFWFEHFVISLLQGDFRAYLRRKGALKPIAALSFALDIARSVN